MLRHTIRLSVLLSWSVFSLPVWAATIGQDTFTEASNTNLENHTPDTGTSWSVDATAEFLVLGASDDLQENAARDNFARETTDIGDDDMDVSTDTTINSTSNARRAGVIGRIPTGESGVANGYHAYRRGEASGTSYRLDKIVTSVTTNLGSYSDAAANTVSQTIKLEIRTAAKKIYVDATERISSTDDVLTGNNFAGIVMEEKVPRMDNWLSESVTTAARRIWLLNRLERWLVETVAADDGRTVEWYVSAICGVGTPLDPRRPCVVDTYRLENWVLQTETPTQMYLRVLDSPTAHVLRTTDRTEEARLPDEVKTAMLQRGTSRIDRR